MESMLSTHAGAVYVAPRDENRTVSGCWAVHPFDFVMPLHVIKDLFIHLLVFSLKGVG